MRCLKSIVADVCQTKYTLSNGHKVNDYRNETDLALNLQKMQVSQQIADLIGQQFGNGSRASVDTLVQTEVDRCDDISELVDLGNTRYFQSPAEKNELANLLHERYIKAVESAKNKEEEEKARAKYDELMKSLRLEDSRKTSN